MYLQFEKAETTWAYLDGVKRTISKEGLPLAYYSDKHGIFKVNRSGALSGNGLTQFGRIIKALGIKAICANSPQAKARVEVLENRDGDIEVEYKNEKLSYTTYEERPIEAEEVSAKELNLKIDSLIKKRYKPTKRHPWKRGFPSLAMNY